MSETKMARSQRVHFSPYMQTSFRLICRMLVMSSRVRRRKTMSSSAINIYIYIYIKKKKDKERRILRESRMEEDEEEVMKGDKNASGKDIYVSGHKITKER